MSEFRIKVRDDAHGYYEAYRGQVIGQPFGSYEAAEDLRRAAMNGSEWEVIEVAKP